MTPPRWLDESGRQVPTYPCFTCGEPQPTGTLAGRHLAMQGWRPIQTQTAVGSCGHVQERLPLPWAGTGGG
jgi:hypothetical protein